MARTALAIAILAATFVASIFALAVAGPKGLFAGVALMLAGFGALAIARTPTAPFRPLQLTVLTSIAVISAMMFGLEWPPRRVDWASWTMLLGTAAIQLTAVSIVRRHRTPAIALLLAPAVYAPLSMIRITQVFLEQGAAATLGPSVTLAFFFSVLMGAAWLTAPIHAWLNSRVEFSAHAS